MNIFRSIVAIVLGLAVGSAVNMGLIMFGSTVIPAPAGMDVSNSESVASGAHLFTAKHFLFPFLAHALGTLAGAVVAVAVAAVRKPVHGWVIGVLFLCGGIAASQMIPAPVWFIAADLLLAYLPMAWIGIQIGKRFG